LSHLAGGGSVKPELYTEAWNVGQSQKLRLYILYSVQTVWLAHCVPFTKEISENNDIKKESMGPIFRKFCEPLTLVTLLYIHTVLQDDILNL
jgi:hypothetical protein